MSEPRIIIGRNILTLEYFAFRENQFDQEHGHGKTPEEAKLDLLNRERLRAMEPEELNIDIKMVNGKIYYGIDGTETAEYLRDEFNLQESFEHFIAYFLPNFYDEEEDDYEIEIGNLL